MNATPGRNKLIWSDRIALSMALLIAGAAFFCWVVGIVGLNGLPHLRFDGAMLDIMVKTEVLLIPPIWLFMRCMGRGARVLGRWLRTG